MQPVKLTTIGNSVGLVLSKDVLARLGLGKGDTVYLTETPDGLHLSRYDPEFAEQMETARALMRKRRNALRELAK